MDVEARRASAAPEPLPCQARVRASYLKHVLKCVSALPAAEADDVRRRLGRALATVEGATRVDWLLPEVALALILAVDEGLGRERLRALYGAAMHSSLHGHLLAPLFSGIARMFALTPERIFRSAPAGYATIWRDGGVIAVESALSGRVVLRHAQLPALLRAPAFLEATAASFAAVPAEWGLPGRGEVAFDGHDTARYVIQW
jgi:hypothetical protein